ncbi:MAG: hypothetical protein QT07_C0005G0005 [archaeon GW2011_AR16]|nr:MAG: hypothetical protein QT07_C0005G0005 [archaeon GW2011_AR16]HII88776.1 hypothetical protein [Candidatus Woesearchaeota archaeon]
MKMRKRVPDKAQARSLILASEQEMIYLDTLTPTVEGASTIIRGIYENFRRLGEALLLLQGWEGDHEDSIQALTALQVKTNRPIYVLDNLRRLRHDINYMGYQPSADDLADVLSIKKECWKPVLEEVKKRV